MNYLIPFNRADLQGNEIRYLQQSIQDGHISGDGPFTRKCQQFLEKNLGTQHALLTTSCTHALEMAALLLDFKPGEEVIIPSFTFVSTVNAFVLHGAQPIFIDISPKTMNLDENKLADLLTPRTKAVVVVHYAGVGCEMDPILSLAGKKGVTVIEDNAHGLFGKYKNRFLGTFGSLATQSFHETKNFTCGEGGALLINDAKFLARAEIIREKGTDRSRFFRGQVDKYTWVDVGSSYLPSDILAAFLFAQFEEKEKILAKRKRIWGFYFENLKDWASSHGVQLPRVPPHCEQSYHMFYLVLPNLEQRQALLSHLKSQGVLAVFHYQPLHLSEMGRKFGGKQGDCPVAERISDCLLRLPFYNNIAEEDLQRVVAAIFSFRG